MAVAPYRSLPRRESSAMPRREMGAANVWLPLVVFLAPTWSIGYAVTRELDPLDFNASDVMLCTVAAILPTLIYAVSLLYARWVGRAWRAYLFMVWMGLILVSLFFASRHTISIGDAGGVAMLGCVMSVPALFLAKWQRIASAAFVASRTRGLAFLARVGVVWAVLGVVISLASSLDAQITSALTLALMVAVRCVASLHARRLEEGFVAWMDGVRAGHHERYAVRVAPTPASALGAPSLPHFRVAESALLRDEDLSDECFTDRGEPVFYLSATRVGAP